MRRTFLAVLVAAVFSLFFFMVMGEKEVRFDLKQKGNSFIEGLRIVHKRDGLKDWFLTAKRADISEDGEKAYLSDIEMMIEKQGLTMHADNGLYTMSNKNLSIEGKVVAKGVNYSITSDRIELAGADGRVKTDGMVNIQGKKFTLQGKGMDIETTEQKMRIHKDVKAIFYQ